MSKQYKLIRCNINGKDVEKMVDVRASLTDMLRNDYHLTSVKKGLRGRRVRCLHRPHRRRDVQLLHLSGRVGRRQAHPHTGGLAQPRR